MIYSDVDSKSQLIQEFPQLPEAQNPIFPISWRAKIKDEQTLDLYKEIIEKGLKRNGLRLATPEEPESFCVTWIDPS